MKIADANIVLRYLLNDTEELKEKAAEILEENEVFLPNEVIAEVVYVLEKVYEVKNDEISDTLKELFEYDNIELSDLALLEAALDLYGKKQLDFVDTLLYPFRGQNPLKIFPAFFMLFSGYFSYKFDSLNFTINV